MFKKLTLTILSLLPLYFMSFTAIFAQAPTIDDLGLIYCERRQGNQLNLETWYGGRCPEGDNYKIEETIGFGDIIILDLYEKLTVSKGSSPAFKEMVEKILSAKNMNEKIIAISSFPTSGAIPNTSKLIASLYQTPPASSVEYVASIINNFQNNKIVQPTYAQTNGGFGFASLTPILKVWRAFRDVAYLAFVLFFIYYGFLIMFRMKINPQTVMNIQIAIPKLVITLLLITFSYAIAGFLIDLFYVAYGFVYSIFAQGNIIETGLGSIITNLLIGNDFTNTVSGYSYGLLGPFIAIMLHIPTLLPKILAGLVGLPTALGYGLVAVIGPMGLVLALILAIAFLYTLIKVLWMLLKSYVTIILQIIFSPIILLGNIFPGSTAFANWVRTIIAELSVFATVMIIFILSFYFIGPLLEIKILGWNIINFGAVGNPPAGGDFWVPPPLFGVSDAAKIGELTTILNAFTSLFGVDVNKTLDVAQGRYAILGAALFLITPSIAKSIRDALKVKEMGYGSTIGAALGFGFSPISKPLGFGINAIKNEATAGLGNIASPYMSKLGLPNRKSGADTRNPEKGEDV